MRLPRGDEVPFTSGISGIVFVLAWFKVGTTLMIPALGMILGTWAVIYLIEVSIRTRRGLTGRPPGSGRPSAGPPPAPTGADRP